MEWCQLRCMKLFSNYISSTRAYIKDRLSSFSLPIPSSITMKKLALIRLSAGILTLLFGIGTTTFLHHNHSEVRTGGAIWIGVFTTVVGGVGIRCALRYTSKYLNMAYMFLNIVSMVVSVSAAVSFIHHIAGTVDYFLSL